MMDDLTTNNNEDKKYMTDAHKGHLPNKKNR